MYVDCSQKIRIPFDGFYITVINKIYYDVKNEVNAESGI